LALSELKGLSLSSQPRKMLLNQTDLLSAIV